MRLKAPTALHLLALLTACATLAIAGVATAREGRPTATEPRLVRISLATGVPRALLQRAGFDILQLSDDQALLLEWPGDAARLAALGLVPDVIDPAPGRSAAARTRAEFAARGIVPGESTGAPRAVAAPPPIGAGALGGFWTSAELKMKLDDLVAGDTHGVVAGKLDTLGWSWAGRPIWGLRLGKAGGPVVFMNALTHAREPEGMQALMYFVDDLLGGYGVDPFATALLDQRALYIVPLVNPDGYAVNESLYVASGGATFGMWRKNVRDNNGSLAFETAVDGVDINRNYGYRWGKNTLGSSPDSTMETYRGPAAFSEPETRSQRDIVAALAPRTCLSFHSWGDLYLHPWGHTDSLVADVAAFREWNDEMARNTPYETGDLQHVLYDSNGDFGDWAYGDTLSKPRAFGWTPEVGTLDDHFWPAPSRIVPLAEENLRACYVATAIAGAFVQAEAFTIDEGAMNASYGAHLRVRARNLGLATTGAGLTGTLVPLDPGVQMLVASVAYPALSARTGGDPLAPFQIAVDDTVTPGRLMRFAIDFTTPGGLYARDTVAAPLGTATVLAADDAAAGLGLWSPGSWGIVPGEPAHPGPFFADSPSGNYSFATNNAMRWLATLDLSPGVHAYATYQARWDLEGYIDGAMFEGSLDGVVWTQLAANGSTPGSGFGIQTPGLPFYAGTRWGWTRERADLSAYSGAPTFRMRFRLRDDGNSTQKDGFNFDSLRVVVFDPAAQPPLVAVGGAPAVVRLALGAPVPNPARFGARFVVSLPRAGRARFEILDLQGRRVFVLPDHTREAGTQALAWDGRDAAGRRVSPGVYVARLSVGGESRAVRFAVVR